METRTGKLTVTCGSGMCLRFRSTLPAKQTAQRQVCRVARTVSVVPSVQSHIVHNEVKTLQHR